MGQIKVMVVDDSAFMRKVITDMLQEDPDIEVVGTARNGQDALAKLKQLKPDVITLDVEMPIMDGLTALEKIMAVHPLPVVMLSSSTQEGTVETLIALEKGAVDFVPKPSGPISLDLYKVKEQLLLKVKEAAQAKVGPKMGGGIPQRARPSKPLPLPPSSNQGEQLKKLVVIGTSTGGPKALQTVVPQLPGNLPAAVLIVQHMPPGFTRSLAERLDSVSALKVKEAAQGEKILPGIVYIAPGDFHMKPVVAKGGVDKHLTIQLNQEAPVNGHRPSVEVMMKAAADEFWGPIVGVILTGMGSDGVEGMKTIKKRCGRTISEDASTCVVYGMPKGAAEAGVVDRVVPLPEIAEEITRMVLLP